MTETTEPRLTRLNALAAWCFEHGAAMPEQRFEVDGEGQCLVRNNRDFDEGTRVLKLPRTCMFTRHNAAETSLVQQFLAAGGEFQTMHGLLALGLLQEFTRPDSFWAPYWAVLPRSFESVPLFLPEPLQPFLAGTMSGAMAGARYRELSAEYAALKEVLGADFDCDLADFFWAYTVCSSRAFAVPDGQGETVPALVPLLDLYNHHPKCNLSGFRPDPDGIVLETAESLGVDTELLVSYGPAADMHYYVNYGFVDRDCWAGQSGLVMQLAGNDPQLAIKKQLMNGVMVWEMMVTATEFDALNACLTIARWISAQELRPQIESRSADEEQRALYVLFSALQESVAGFHQSFAQDVADLAAPDELGSFAAQMVRRMTLSEKRVLLQAQVFCERAMAELGGTLPDWEKPDARWLDEPVLTAWLTAWRASLGFALEGA